ncbi:MAG TPA: hypothetical protein VFT47_04285 [Vicinamibacterales bacterium]|nr:hypothetical protein [Vicinamibacterales bacterium]
MATFNSTVSCGSVNLNGTFDYTPPNPPTSTNGTLGGTYTLSGATSGLSMTNTSTNGASVQFSIATGGQTYSFNGAYTSGTNQIVGRTTPCASPKQDPDNWTASAQ